MRRSTTYVSLIALVLGLFSIAAAPPAPGGPIVRVIVTFADGVGSEAAADGLARRFGGEVAFVYSHALNGAAIDLPQHAFSGLARSPGVSQVEADGPVSITEQVVQQNATWGLDRIDQRTLPLDTKYIYESSGSGVTAYVIDTGIRATHDEFEDADSGVSRVEPGFDAFDPSGTGTTDCNGHGTHVAGTIGGLTYGVAKDVTLVPVRVLDCNGSGTWSGVIAGIDWAHAKAGGDGGPSVANLSLSGGPSDTVDAAVTNLAGVALTAVAAANDGGDACNYSPARVDAALTVGATNSSDAVASFSNQGACVDIFAPGVGITSAYSGRQGFYTDSTTATISGTSMAAPHAAGVAALIGETSSSAPSESVFSHIVDNASTGNPLLSGLKTNSPDLLLYSLVGSLFVEPVTDVAISIISPVEGAEVTEPSQTVEYRLEEVGGIAVDGPITVTLGISGPNGYGHSASDVAVESGTVLAAGDSLNGAFAWPTGDLSPGDYTITVSHDVVNTNLATSASLTVVVPADEPVGEEPAALTASVDLFVNRTGPWYRPNAIFTVLDGSNVGVGGVPVVAAWSLTGGGSGTVSCTTDESGTCTSEVLRTRTPGQTLTVTITSVNGVEVVDGASDTLTIE